MPIRYRLVMVLLALHLVSSLGAGGLTWWWLQQQVDHQRHERAVEVATVLAHGGFSPTNEVLTRMADLAGTTFRIVRPDSPENPGAVRITVDQVMIEVDQPHDGWRLLTAGSIVTLLVFIGGGAALLAAAAWWTARAVTNPVTRLAAAARSIGAGNIDHVVPAVGSGEVAALAKDLEHMRQRLAELEATARRQERLAVLGTFAATIAHEVRNPLSAIRLTVQVIKQRHPHDDNLAVIEEEIERLDLVVDQLLHYARGLSITPVSCALHTVADSVIRLLARQARFANIELTRHGEACVHADPLRLRQLLLNLVLNAMQAQPDGGQVVIDIRPDGCAVRDQGPGLNSALLPHLFESFARGRADGTGLGLHLSWSIAQAHQATLRYEAGLPHGAVFILAGLPSAS